MELVLEDGQHTFDASTKEITLAAPYTGLSEGQILKIVNLTTHAVIYEAETLRFPISISGAVITHTYDSTGMADTDLLQVIIDVGSSSSPIYVSSGTGATALSDGRQVVTTAATAAALAASTACKRVTVTAEEDNTGIIVVGGTSVVAALATRRGTPLHPLDSCSLDADDLAEVFIDAMVSGDGVTFVYTV